MTLVAGTVEAAVETARVLIGMYVFQRRYETLGHFTFWISLLRSPNTTYTHRPQGVNYR